MKRPLLCALVLCVFGSIGLSEAEAAPEPVQWAWDVVIHIKKVGDSTGVLTVTNGSATFFDGEINAASGTATIKKLTPKLALITCKLTYIDGFTLKFDGTVLGNGLVLKVVVFFI
jgi:hypothetical protein